MESEIKVRYISVINNRCRLPKDCLSLINIDVIDWETKSGIDCAKKFYCINIPYLFFNTNINVTRCKVTYEKEY